MQIAQICSRLICVSLETINACTYALDPVVAFYVLMYIYLYIYIIYTYIYIHMYTYMTRTMTIMMTQICYRRSSIIYRLDITMYIAPACLETGVLRGRPEGRVCVPALRECSRSSPPAQLPTGANLRPGNGRPRRTFRTRETLTKQRDLKRPSKYGQQ